MPATLHALSGLDHEERLWVFVSVLLDLLETHLQLAKHLAACSERRLPIERADMNAAVSMIRSTERMLADVRQQLARPARTVRES